MHPFHPLRTTLALALVAGWMLLPHAAFAADVGFDVNAEGAASHLVGENKSGQFGWGATGLIAPELRIGKVVGIELPVGVVGLSEASKQDPAYMPSANGSAFLAMPGLRLRPFSARWGEPLWLAGGGGIARTGGATRPTVDVRAGIDVRVRRFDIGPFAGLVQIVDPDAGVRSQDARLVLFGIHVSASPFAPKEIGVLPVVMDRREPVVVDGDRDGDGIPDSIDKCPDEPEDFDGFQDADGCPDPDNDGDGIPDVRDKCPNEPETFNGFEDEDGCPDEEFVRISGDHIQLDDRVLFQIDQSKILNASYPMLQNVAKLLNDHTEYEQILLTGHADDTGESDYNMRLSEARARSVRAFLVKAGVTEARLNVEFFGKTRPRVEGRSVEARRQNRRVEFEITQRRVAKILPPPLAPRVEQTAQAHVIPAGAR